MSILTLLAFVGAVWTTDGTDSLLARVDKLDFANVAIGRCGQVCLAPRLEPRPPLSEAQAWQVAVDRAGSVWCATGNQGRVYRLGRGAPEVVFDSGATEVLALASDRAGNVFFGSTPQGNIYRVRPGGRPELVLRTGESYVFSLLPDSAGALYCATGTGGRLLRLAPGASRAETVFTAPQAQLTALCWLVPDRELLAGTSPDGIVYKLSFKAGRRKPDVSVLYDTPLAEVRALAVDRSGRAFIAANSAGDGDTAGPRVFCVRDDGTLRWTWAGTDSTVFALALPAAAGSPAAVLAATGNRGIVYQIDTLGRSSVLCRTSEPLALCLAATAGGTWLATGNPARLYFLASGYADSGYVTSPAHDCTNPAAFGALSSRATVPAGTELRFDTRSGNSSTPDSTWSAWAEAGTQSGATVTSPAARYVQWRARLKSTFPDRTPALERVDLYFEPPNRPPAIHRLDIGTVAADDARRGSPRPIRDVSWNADDPDSDSLVYDLYFRPAGATAWLTLAPSVGESHRELDTRALVDGWYQLRLVASDRPERTAPAALTAEEVSHPFLVDNTPPVISAITAGPAGAGKATIKFSARDALSPLAGCRVSVNAGTWLPVDPLDGLFDSPAEEFSATVDLAPGDNTVAVLVTDDQGNQAAARTTVRR